MTLKPLCAFKLFGGSASSNNHDDYPLMTGIRHILSVLKSSDRNIFTGSDQHRHTPGWRILQRGSSLTIPGARAAVIAQFSTGGLFLTAFPGRFPLTLLRSRVYRKSARQIDFGLACVAYTGHWDYELFEQQSRCKILLSILLLHEAHLDQHRSSFAHSPWTTTAYRRLIYARQSMTAPGLA